MKPKLAIPDRLLAADAARKQSKPKRVDGFWRIRRHDGELVGWYESERLAIKAIATSPWLR